MENGAEFIRDIELESVNVTLNIIQESVGDVGCVVWDAAIVLCKYLEVKCAKNRLACKGDPLDLEGCSVLEVGAGTGAVGLTAAALGAASVTVTDLPEFIPLMKKNIEKNKEHLKWTMEAEELVWGREEHLQKFRQPDILLVADCIYYDQSLEPLVKTLTKLCSPYTVLLMSYEDRTVGDKPQLQRDFFDLMEKDFIGKEVPQDELHETFRCDEIHIYQFKKKK
ncbi:protein N-lysine methyltransferase METTL21D-like [Oratosquilla oratoria]|uniref:protein N-lysine methyltransferase METTL21D-like n=1 Tax=Oratosquilla oratoria TaxID=337810 RepID=UPI003F76CBAE